MDIAKRGGRCYGGGLRCAAVAGMRQRLPHNVRTSPARSSASHSAYTSNRPSTFCTRRKRRVGHVPDRFPLARTVHAILRPWELKRGNSWICREQLVTRLKNSGGSCRSWCSFRTDFSSRILAILGFVVRSQCNRFELLFAPICAFNPPSPSR